MIFEEAWYNISLALEKFTKLLEKHAKECDGKVETWEHSDVGSFHFECKKCGFRGSLSVVRQDYYQRIPVTPVPTLHVVWFWPKKGKEEEDR